MFIATPWMPVGRPNLKSWRMMFQSGIRFMPLWNATTHLPLKRRTMAYPLTSAPAVTVPIAAPLVPKAGIGPRPRMKITLSVMFRMVSAIPSRNGVLASPAERSAPPSMKKSSMPNEKTNMMRRYGSASTCTSGEVIRLSRYGDSTYPIGAMITRTSRTAVKNA